MKIRKPIMQFKGSDSGFKYKNVFTAYALNVPLEFETDLSKMQFNRFLDGKYNRMQIEKFEMTGRF